jgi:2-polyprenyl-6-hydroxyphenyl methylase/3-demethylubiquinone-9 3-methyltransferase
VRKTIPHAYQRLDNRIYDVQGGTWWLPGSFLSCMRTVLNPVRVAYIKNRLAGGACAAPKGKRALEVGCGGGCLTEEIARMGFDTWGIDPSRESIAAAEAHARIRGFPIHYREGVGESLPYPDAFFDAVFCCDVLEHVREPARVIAETARVLKTGGVFHYGTFNRTRLSELAVIKVAQEWKRWAFMPPGVHVWETFIKPREMRGLLRLNGLAWREHRGIGLGPGVLKTLGLLRRRARGELALSELAERCVMSESRNTSVMYMGFAVKE